MGCCKSRGGLFNQKDDLKNVPEKYRSVIKRGNDKEIKELFTKEIEKLTKPGGKDLLDVLKADIDDFGKGLLAQVRADRKNIESKMNDQLISSKASLQA